MKLNEPGREKLERQSSWHQQLYSYLLQALEKEPLIALGFLAEVAVVSTTTVPHSGGDRKRGGK